MEMTTFGDNRYNGSVDFGTIYANRYWVTYHTYDFENFFHPMVGQLIQALNNASGDPVAAMLDPNFLGQKTPFFSSEYQVETDDVDVTSYSAGIDLDYSLPYANYNWELLYHIPVAVAVHLSRNQRFAEAQQWFHYVFDPTATDPTLPAPQCFWKFLYFREHPENIDLDQLLVLLATPQSQLTPTQAKQAAHLLTSYEASITTPFDPFAVARSRPVAFQYYVVMKYLDNLIAWGDSLFSQMTIETVNEATLCYCLAANLLGPKPQAVPEVGTTASMCYNDLKGGLDVLGDALVSLEAEFPFNIPTAPNGGGTSLFGTGQTLYFGVPANAQLLAYWDTVDDRLTKIRNCENISGQVQLMPLFDPPIDPGMLVAAAAAGLNIGTVVSGLNQPVGPVRAPVLIQKATELCNEVRSLGAGLLSAIEKGDAEHLALLRQNNEVSMEQLTQNIRYLRWQQAQAATESLLRSRTSTLERYTFYLRDMGLSPNPATAPSTFSIDHTTVITEENFTDAYNALVAQYDLPISTMPYAQLTLAQASSPATQSGASGTGNLYLNTNEDAELNDHMPRARDLDLASQIASSAAPVLALVPSLEVDLHYWGLGAHTKILGGDWLAGAANSAAGILKTLASWQTAQGAMASRTASYQRRADDWMLQANLAARELSAIGRQLLTSLLAEQAARADYSAAKSQVGLSKAVVSYMQSKFSNEQLYGWLQGQLSALYYQYYRLALDTARKAEATAKWELRRPELDANTYIQPNYWDSGYQGLTSGEALSLDLKHLEMDYIAYNQRELELTRHVSLRQLDPMALLNLKITGSCTLSIPEWLYDRDCPGLYMRRLKSVAASVPSVVGAYTSVNLTLSLQASSVRVSPELSGGSYQRGQDDPRFIDYYGSVDTVVTSGAVADSGMFETNLRDERFLPFEGNGAISTWALSLPPVPAFDYSTITDVVLHIRYTARDGGEALGAAANKALKELPPSPGGGSPAPTLALLLSLRHDFPTQWYAFTTGGGASFTAPLNIEYFPYLVQTADLTVDSISVYAANGDQVAPAPAIPVPSSMTSANIKAGTAVLDLPDDGSVLVHGQPAKEVYVVIAYTAKF